MILYMMCREGSFTLYIDQNVLTRIKSAVMSIIRRMSLFFNQKLSLLTIIQLVSAVHFNGLHDAGTYITYSETILRFIMFLSMLR